MAKYRAFFTADNTIVMSPGTKDDFKNAYEWKLKGLAYSSKIKEGQSIGRVFTIDSSNPFISKNKEKIGDVSFDKDKRNRLKGLSDSKSNRGGGGQGSQKSKGGKQTHTAGGDFRGKIQPTQVDDKKLSYSNVETKQAVDRVKRQGIPEKDVQTAFNKWANIDPRTKDYVKGQTIPRDQDQIAKAYNNYEKSKTAATRFKRWRANQEYDRILEHNEDAVISLSSLPSAIRSTKTIAGGWVAGKGYAGEIKKSFAEATQKQGLGPSDRRFKKGWFWGSTRQSKLEKAALEAEEEYAKADVSEAKAIGEEGKERAVRSEIKRKSEIDAEKKARAGFWRRMGVPVGRKSLAVERVETERMELDTAKKVTRQEGKAAVEAVQTQRRAGRLQEGAIGARQRAQRLEAKELQRIETKLDEGAPLSKADQSKLKFIRDYSEATPSGFIRGEKQFKSIVAPSEAEIAAAKEWARQQSRQQGRKK